MSSPTSPLNGDLSKMMSSDEHREACRVYMQKYRSKPENREKIRQQNAEYRKRKKMESIRQVSEIGSLEHTLDMQALRIKLLEAELRDSKLKVDLLEKDTRIPQYHLTHITRLQSALDAKSNQVDQVIRATIETSASFQMSPSTSYVNLASAIQSITNTPHIHVAALQKINAQFHTITSPITSPILASTNTNTNTTAMASSTMPPTLKKELSSSSLSSSSPPSSPSMQYIPTSPPTMPMSPLNLSSASVTPVISAPSTPTSFSSPSFQSNSSSFPLHQQLSFRLVPESPTLFSSQSSQSQSSTFDNSCQEVSFIVSKEEFHSALLEVGGYSGKDCKELTDNIFKVKEILVIKHNPVNE
eukprot:gene14505-17120_t